MRVLHVPPPFDTCWTLSLHIYSYDVLSVEFNWTGVLPSRYVFGESSHAHDTFERKGHLSSQPLPFSLLCSPGHTSLYTITRIIHLIIFSILGYDRLFRLLMKNNRSIAAPSSIRCSLFFLFYASISIPLDSPEINKEIGCLGSSADHVYISNRAFDPDGIKKINKRGETMDGYIKRLDGELAQYKDQPEVPASRLTIRYSTNRQALLRHWTRCLDLNDYDVDAFANTR
ncbi:hypothetical protein L2E82_16732 [Cichorium intybus]|uniref:Uncharacterized protein n=1 Tax=Cichorium intybus TaxID=13427 RepID=A0ACB9F6Y8_CICIN|nr:hypothetical protein L2E82_16732 [Cichorium intybus]